MIKTILAWKAPLKKRLKIIGLYILQKRVAKKAWNNRHDIVFDKHPEFNQPLNSELRKKHRAIWEPFNKKFSNATLKICRSISADADPTIIPEEIFQADIEPSLNHYPEAHFLAHKSFYNRWHESGLLPEDLLHVVDGEILDSDLSAITAETATERIESFSYPVVMKPSMETGGGKNIRFVEHPSQLKKLIGDHENAVIQNKIQQHPDLSKYHSTSLNTVRVYLYRSVTDNKYHIINTAFRMGNGGLVDNVTAGGIVSRVKSDGHLHGYALDMYGEKYFRHPVSNLPFTGAIPDFKKLNELSLEIAQKLLLLRVVGLDLCYDKDGKWRLIEINTRSHSIRFAQYAGVPFFGEFTEEVIEYCKKNHWTGK